MLPMVLGLLATALASDTIVSRSGQYRAFPIAGSAVTAAGLFLLSRMDSHTSFWLVSLFLLVLGAGIGLIMQILTLVVPNTVADGLKGRLGRALASARVPPTSRNRRPWWPRPRPRRPAGATAPAVVDAAGGWVRQVSALAGARVPVATVRHQLLITEPDGGIDPADPIARVVDAAVYLRPARGGLMAGGFEPDPLPLDPERQAASFSTDDVPLDLDVLRKLAGQIATEAPAAGTAPVAEHRGGLFTMSPDGRFVAGPVPGVNGLWVASGCNGSGFSSSLGIGEALSGWITSGDAPGGWRRWRRGGSVRWGTRNWSAAEYGSTRIIMTRPRLNGRAAVTW